MGEVSKRRVLGTIQNYVILKAILILVTNCYENLGAVGVMGLLLGQNCRGGMRVSEPPILENLPFRSAKTVVQCISAEQLTGPMTNDQLKQKRSQMNLQGNL